MRGVLPYMSVLSFLTALGVYLAVPSFWTLRSSFSDAQFFSFPFIVLALLFMPRLKVVMPRLVLVSLLVIWAVLLSGFHKSIFLDESPSLSLAVFPDDTLEIDTSIVKRRLSQELSRYELGEVVTFPRTILRMSHLPEFHHTPILWGSKRWLNMSYLGSRGQLPVSEIGGYSFIDNIPVFGLSWKPADATLRFLTHLIVVEDALRKADLDRAESHLLAASAAEAFWTSNAHRAYPLFLLGNLYVTRALKENYQPAYLECAIKSYATASAFLQPADNPLLLAAIYQNKAVALLLFGEGRFEERFLESRKLFKNAREFLGYAGPWPGVDRAGIANAISENEIKLRQLRVQ